jgi:hypothetical protein
MQIVCAALAGLAGAFSTALWFDPETMDVKLATYAAGLSALVCAALVYRLIDVLRRER